MPDRVFYFAYGSNMPRMRLEQRVGTVEVHGRGWLGRHALRFHKRGQDGSGKCDARFSGSAEDTVHGVVFSLGRAQLDVLHEYEGVGYECREVGVQTAVGALAAVTYFAVEHAISEGIRPFDWYLALVCHGAEEHALPGWYRRQVASIQTAPDDDPVRARRHFDLIAEGSPSKSSFAEAGR